MPLMVVLSASYISIFESLILIVGVLNNRMDAKIFLIFKDFV